MEKINVLTHPQFGTLTYIVINGKEFFKAKDCATMLGYKDTTNAIKQHCRGVVKHHLPTKSGVQEVNLIPEGDIWRLITHSKLSQAKEIEKWIMDEVLPTIRKTGSYSMVSQIPETPYEYFDKTFNGIPVLTIKDIAYFTGFTMGLIACCIKDKLIENTDYYKLKGMQIPLYKKENPREDRHFSHLYVVTKSGFKKICNCLEVETEPVKQLTPKVKHPTVKQLCEAAEKKKEYALPYDSERFQSTIKMLQEEISALSLLLNKMNRHNVEMSDFNNLRGTLDELGMEISSDLRYLRYYKVPTTNKVKL